MLRRSTETNVGRRANDSVYPYVQLFMKENKKEEQERLKCAYKKAVKVIFTQVSGKEGIKRWGEKAIAAIIKELKQLQDGAMSGRPIIEPVDPSILTFEDKTKHTLEAVTVLK